MAPNLLIYICISELTKQRDNARLRTLVERNQVMQQRRAFGFNSDDAGDDFHDYASNESEKYTRRYNLRLKRRSWMIIPWINIRRVNRLDADNDAIDDGEEQHVLVQHLVVKIKGYL